MTDCPISDTSLLNRIIWAVMIYRSCYFSIMWYSNVLQCQSRSFKVIKVWNFKDRSLRNENFRKNLNGQSPSGAGGRICSQFTFNVIKSNYIPNESSWHGRNEKMAVVVFHTFLLNKITHLKDVFIHRFIHHEYLFLHTWS